MVKDTCGWRTEDADPGVGRRAAACSALVSLLVLGIVMARADAAPPSPRDPASGGVSLVDPAVVPAGGLSHRHCGKGGGICHHPHCRNGLCVPHCPVRPSEFGYYGTQWRRWPGQGVVPAAAFEGVTPVKPPKSAVPSADEESPRRSAEEPPVPEPIPDPDPAGSPRSDTPPAGGADATQSGGWRRFVVKPPSSSPAGEAPAINGGRGVIRLSSGDFGQDVEDSARGR